MRKFAIVLALIMMLGVSGCNSEMNSEGDPSITQSSSVRAESTQSSSTLSQQSTPASLPAGSETSVATIFEKADFLPDREPAVFQISEARKIGDEIHLLKKVII